MQLKLYLDTNHLSKIPKLLSFFADLIKCPAMMPETILSGLAFPEGPRWHDGALYFSDMHAGMVWRLTPDGVATQVTTVPNSPSGLGWFADGTFAIVSMLDRRLPHLGPDATARG